MNWIVANLWLIPALPLVAAGVSALAKRSQRWVAAGLAIGSLSLSFVLSCVALVSALGQPGVHAVRAVDWFTLGETTFRLGWVLDPLTAVMVVMITFVGTLIFIFSLGYMAKDENFTRFFCFLAFFAAAMLGLVIANNLLMLFMCWELVGMASYLLIGFWYHKPSAAAAAKKAFITTRIGDLGFFLGLLWLYAESGTLLFYDGGAGCLESSTLAKLVGQVTLGGMAVSTGISLLLFCGAIGKSGQVPLHVWLPDAMEGPTPVSALIHAATMVAAGVFLVARVYPLMAAVPAGSVPATAAMAAATEITASAHAPARGPTRVVRADPDPVLHRNAPESLDAHPSAAAATAPGQPTREKGTNLPAAAAATASAAAGESEARPTRTVSVALRCVTWVGAITAVFAALIAVAQSDIKRILAYSTVSQLGFMFVGLGAGGVAVGMFHLLTHAFFKALLFLGSGSVIHGCHEEQDIRLMGGLRKLMPVTFATYAVGMMALAGVPPLCGFWSKDEILHAAWSWPASSTPFWLAVAGAFLTAFYMTRQMVYVFFGTNRSGAARSPVAEIPAAGRADAAVAALPGEADSHGEHERGGLPHESPPVMTVPLAVLAACAIVLGAFGTPVFPWFDSFLSGHPARLVATVNVETLLTMLLSTCVVALGLGVGWRVYRRRPITNPDALDPLEELNPAWFGVLRRKFFVDELYEKSVIPWLAWLSRAARRLDDQVWSVMVSASSTAVVAVSYVTRLLDEYVVNLGFDRGCGMVRLAALLISWWQNGQVQRYLRAVALALAVAALIFIWGCTG